MSSAVVGVDQAGGATGAATADEPHDDDDLISGPEWSRHPLDVVRLVVAGLALVASGALAVRHPASVRSVSVDLVQLVAQLPRWLRDLVLGTTQLLAITLPMVMVVLLARTPRMLWTALGSAAAAAAAMAALQTRLDDAVPHRVQEATERASWLAGAAFPSGAYLAGFVAVVIVLGPVLSRGWRRAALVGVAIASLGRVVTAVAVPLNLAVTISLGAVVGSAVLVAFGSPRRKASRRDVLSALGRAGFPAQTIEPYEVVASHSRTFVATDGPRRAFVKLLGRDERSADLLYRAMRALRVKDLDDERPSWTPSELVDHDALTALLAARRIPVPEVLAVGSTEGGDGLIAVELVDGPGLDELEPHEVTDELLDQAWAVVDGLRRQGIAHRWLTTSHLIVCEEPTPRATEPGRDVESDAAISLTLVDFHWAVQQAEPEQLAADVATLAVSLALQVGAERAVAAAARVLEPGELASALPLVQPLALPDDLRAAVKGNDALLPLVRKQLQDAAGGVEYRLADIERISWRHLVSLAGVVVISYSLLSFASNWDDIADALQAMSLADAPLLIVLALVPYVAGAGTFMSVVPRHLPFGEVVRLMLGQSFLNRFTPANAGGMALRVRYLQKRGVDIGGAAAGVGLTSVASAIGQVAVLAIFAAWAGSGSGVSYSLPDGSRVAVGAAIVATLTGVVWFTPLGRRLVGRRLETSFRSVWKTLRQLSHEPARFVTLFATTLVSKVAIIAAFIVSCRAVGIGASYGLARLGLLYITASSIGAAAPSPGGVGAVEAALTAALTGAGVPPADALAAVFLFRLATYWLPVPFGYLALHRLQSTILE